MLLLMVDTAGAGGGVLLGCSRADSGSNAAENADLEFHILDEREFHPRAFSTEMIPALTQLLLARHLRLQDLNAIGVVTGPGSFTGLRVGISAVKAMAEATGKPVLAISRLAMLASTAVRHTRQVSNEPVHVVLDAGRGEFYHGVYRDAGKARVSESFATMEALVSQLKATSAPVFVAEPGVKAVLDEISGNTVQEIPLPTVHDALPLAANAWQSKQYLDAASLAANYLRRSDAILKPKSTSNPHPAQTRRVRL